MTDKKLNITDSRMLKLMEWAVFTKLVQTESEYFAKIEFARQNISNVRRGHQRFTIDHIINAAKLTGANANWIFGLETNMLRKDPKSIPERLKQIVIELEVKESKSSPKKSIKT